MDAAKMIDVILDQGGFEVTRTVALQWLNEKYEIMVGQSKWRRSVFSLGSTTDGTAAYTVSGTVISIEGEGVMVAYADGAKLHEQVSPQDMWLLESGQSTLKTDTRGAYTDDYATDGTWKLKLWPVPDETGKAITALAALNPVPLTDSSSDVAITPLKTHTALVEGAIALGKARIDERYDAADRDEARFTAVVDQLAGDLMTRDGPGVQQIKVFGRHFR